MPQTIRALAMLALVIAVAFTSNHVRASDNKALDSEVLGIAASRKRSRPLQIEKQHRCCLALRLNQ